MLKGGQILWSELERLESIKRAVRGEVVKGRGVYSVAVPCDNIAGGLVSEVIHLVEEEGWRLEHVSAYSWWQRFDGVESEGKALLVFRRLG